MSGSDGTTTSYTVENLTLGQTYVFLVRAVGDGVGEQSPPSNQVSVTLFWSACTCRIQQSKTKMG